MADNPTFLLISILEKEDWLKEHPELSEPKTCSNCDGEKEVQCFECGHVEECVECDGKGVIEPNELEIDHLYRDYVKEWTKQISEGLKQNGL